MTSFNVQGSSYVNGLDMSHMRVKETLPWAARSQRKVTFSEPSSP